MIDAGNLHIATAAVCPITGVSVGDPNNRATWSFIPASGATPAQIAAGNNVLATAALGILNIIAFAVFLARWQDSEYALLGQKRAAAISSSTNMSLVRNWDISTAQNVIDLNSTFAQNLKTALVSNNILTQARADAVFS